MIGSTLRFLKLFKEGYRRGQLKQYFSIFKRLFIQHRRQFYRDFYFETNELLLPDASRFENSRKLVAGLHEVLSADKKITFSIVIDGNSEKTLQSAHNQTAPYYEIVKDNPIGSHILFLREGDFIRLDFLYRYEQILRLVNDPNLVLFIGKETLHYPYEFELKYLPALLIPAHFYNEVKDLDPFAMPLKLDALGAKFLAVDSNIFETTYDPKYPEPLPYFKKYGEWKNLDWIFEKGLTPTSVKATPPLIETPHIQVIIPFKDQKELTLKAVNSVLKSKGVSFEITCVDNRSQDLSIGEALKSKNVNVIRVDEPFNYSRLNNLAASTSQSELICFMNNDAEIDETALLEMARWALLPHIGLVGSRLNYPSGTLQHGGIKLDPDTGYKKRMNWIHVELNKTDKDLNKGKTLYIADGVTAAFSLVRRSLFNRVHGFDEKCFPVAYSDTNLGQKIRKLGYLSLYNPYAQGVHHESLSRKTSPLEDFDNSVYWDELVGKHFEVGQ